MSRRVGGGPSRQCEPRPAALPVAAARDDGRARRRGCAPFLSGGGGVWAVGRSSVSGGAGGCGCGEGRGEESAAAIATHTIGGKSRGGWWPFFFGHGRGGGGSTYDEALGERVARGWAWGTAGSIRPVGCADVGPWGEVCAHGGVDGRAKASPPLSHHVHRGGGCLEDVGSSRLPSLQRPPGRVGWYVVGGRGAPRGARRALPNGSGRRLPPPPRKATARCVAWCPAPSGGASQVASRAWR